MDADHDFDHSVAADVRGYADGYVVDDDDADDSDGDGDGDGDGNGVCDGCGSCYGDGGEGMGCGRGWG